jgi:hypothetical protein
MVAGLASSPGLAAEQDAGPSPVRRVAGARSAAGAGDRAQGLRLIALAVLTGIALFSYVPALTLC